MADKTLNITESAKIMRELIGSALEQFANMHSLMKSISLVDENSFAQATQILAELDSVCQVCNSTAKHMSETHNQARGIIIDALKVKQEKLDELKQKIAPETKNASEPTSKVWAAKAAAPAKKPVKTEKPEKAERIIAVPSHNRENELQDYEIAPNVFIKAYAIDKPSDCFNHLGWKCYCQTDGFFWHAMNGTMISGRVLRINRYSEKPYKYVEHRDAGRKKIKPDSTDFYIPNTNDIRELTDRERFVPAGDEPLKNELYVYRVGCRDSLAKDLAEMTPEQYRLMQDKCGHWELVGLMVQITGDRCSQ
jgi:ElaB/YqjD/DUF883 family membrane-anchored ribosome-binding protein